MIGTTITTKLPIPIVDAFSKNIDNVWVFVFIIIGLVVVFLAVLMFKGNLKLKLPGGTEVDISGSDDSKDKKSDQKKDDKSGVKDDVLQPPPTVLLSEKSPHTFCPHVVDFKHVVTKTTYVISKISEIRYKGCLSEQMGHVEEQFINIRTLYQKLYLEKLREKLKEKGKQIKREEEYLYEDYKFYQTLIKLMLHDMVAVVRASFANNHLADYDSNDYQRYIELKFNVIRGLESDFLDTMYIGDWVVSRKDVFDFHRSARLDVKETIQNIYINAQRIAVAKGKEIEDLQDDLQDFLDETVSGEIKIKRTG